MYVLVRHMDRVLDAQILASPILSHGGQTFEVTSGIR